MFRKVRKETFLSRPAMCQDWAGCFNLCYVFIASHHSGGGIPMLPFHLWGNRGTKKFIHGLNPTEPGKADGSPSLEIPRRWCGFCGYFLRKHRNAPPPQALLGTQTVFPHHNDLLSGFFSEASRGTRVRSLFMAQLPSNLQLQDGGKVSSYSVVTWSKSWAPLRGPGLAAERGLYPSPPGCPRPSEWNVHRVSSQQITQTQHSHLRVCSGKETTYNLGAVHHIKSTKLFLTHHKKILFQIFSSPIKKSYSHAAHIGFAFRYS